MIFFEHAKVESSMQEFLNQELHAGQFKGSPRAVGDQVEELVQMHVGALIPGIKNFERKFARRAMEDLAFEDEAGNYYVVDVKTHNLQTQFNMPNLISVQRIAKFYRESTNYFCLLKIDSDTSAPVPVSAVHFVPIEHLDWRCLTLGALGWGQIQIANARNVICDRGQGRKAWMLKLCDALDLFYPNEIRKITERQTHFAEERRFWEAQPD